MSLARAAGLLLTRVHRAGSYAREVGMGFLNKLRGKRNVLPEAPGTVRCPTCSEENAPSAVVCTICRGALPQRTEQQIRSVTR